MPSSDNHSADALKRFGSVALAQHESRTSLWGDKRGYGFGALAVLLASVMALALEAWVHLHNLVLLYVLAVVATGLRYGSRPAVAASVLSFMGFNFFLTEPRHTFAVTRQDELATLLFLFLIAIVSGPAASQIRRQFLLLREFNRYSEAMRNLGQALSVAENDTALWQAAAQKLTSTLRVPACIAVREVGGNDRCYPDFPADFAAEDRAALARSFASAAPSGRFIEPQSAAQWTLFPILREARCVACAMLHLPQRMTALPQNDRDLIERMLQQVADTWQRIQLVSDLESARVKTEVEQLRSALLSSVSHDLRSPLAAMMGAAESLRLLDQQLDAADRRELLDTLVQESQRLDSYIQNLLDMTRLGYGTLKIERDWVSCADIVGSALGRFKRYYPQVKSDVVFQQPAPLLYVHAALIEQALFNVLENAARFSPQDEKVRVLVTADDRVCIISVEDRGPGIPPALRDKIFDMFFVVADGDKKKPGTGMGLAICRGMIGAHGGRVSATDTPEGKGTRIEIVLPIVPTMEE